jgi:cytochrome c oxidase subunit IV
MSNKHDLDENIYFAQLGYRRWSHIPASMVANMLKAGAIVKRSQAGTEWETIATSPKPVTADLHSVLSNISTAQKLG